MDTEIISHRQKKSRIPLRTDTVVGKGDQRIGIRRIAGKCLYSSNRLNRRVPFVPPKPKELLRAY